MQLDSLSQKVFEDLSYRFEDFCSSFEAPLEPSSPSPLLLVIDHPFAARWGLLEKYAPQKPERVSVLVGAPSRSILDPYLKTSQGIQGMILKENTPAFTASFKTIILYLLGVPSIDPETLLKNWARCLAPQGTLFFLLLGELSFYELFQNPSFAENCPSPQFLSQKSLSWTEGFQKTVQEEWIGLQNPSFFTLQTMSKLIFKESDFLIAPLLDSLGREKHQKTLNRLTLHFLYGAITKLEQNNDL